jgi:hypothetical protein
MSVPFDESSRHKRVGIPAGCTEVEPEGPIG